MKSTSLAMVCLAVLFSVNATAKTMFILNFNRGELPDNSSACASSLSEENAEKEGEVTLKLEFEGRGWCGMYLPKKSSWTGFKKLKFVLVNAGETPIKDVGFCVKGARGGGGPDNRKDYKFEIPPGAKEFEFTFYGDLCNDGKSPLDTSKVVIWNFDNYKAQKVSFFVRKLWIED